MDKYTFWDFAAGVCIALGFLVGVIGTLTIGFAANICDV